jgi:hypothetical protein
MKLVMMLCDAAYRNVRMSSAATVTGVVLEQALYPVFVVSEHVSAVSCPFTFRK